MKRALLIGTVLLIAVISTACINNFAVQELNNKAKIYLEKGDYEAAINRLEASIDLDNTIFETNYNLGIAYIKANNYKKSINVLNQAAKLKPDYADTYYSLGIAHEAYADYLEDLKPQKSNNTNVSDDEDDIKIEPEADDKLLSTEEKKEKVISNYKAAISAYETYLEKANNAKDTDDIKSQIADIKEKLAELEAK